MSLSLLPRRLHRRAQHSTKRRERRAQRGALSGGELVEKDVEDGCADPAQRAQVLLARCRDGDSYDPPVL